MNSVVELLHSWSPPRAIALALIAVGVAGCSVDSTRFNDSPFASSRQSSNEVTGSVPASRASANRVEQSPLPPPPGSQPATVLAVPVGISGGGRGMASYAPSSPEYTGSVQAPPPASSRSSRAPSRTPSPTAVAPLGASNASAGVHVVAPGDTLSKISRRYGKSIPDLAKANNITPQATLKIGDRLVIPGTRAAKAQPKDAAKLAQGKPLTAPAGKTAPAPKPQAAAEPAQSASVGTPVPETPAPTGSAKASAAASPSFRWPVKGRVIAGFGSSANGQQNDGINIAVPENTPVKAAEDGVVACAGSELKGYGNLVLVRHANGFVTAYAHASELNVKKGETVKRGQVIGKAGSTGNVTGPQLHFEVRKGATPVDPAQYLGG